MSELQDQVTADSGGGAPENRPDPWMSSVTNVSAFLAGFSLASVVVIADGPDHFRWPGTAVLALTIASVVLILAAQESRRGARYSRTYSARARYFIWVAYHAGIIALLVGLGAVLAPRDGAGGQQDLRWAAAYIALFAALGEMSLAARTLVKRATGGTP